MKKRILVIDDEHDMALLIKANLEKHGYEVEYALNGEVGIQKAHSFKPDFITLDILMPNLNGLQVLELLKSEPELSKIPVIMLSIVADVGREKILSLGAARFIKKPVDFRNLVEDIHASIEEITLSSSGERDVLIIDDEKAMANMTKFFLTKKGFNVTCAIGGKEGLKQARLQKPDIIVLDLQMPEMDGFEVIKQLKNTKETQDIPVVIFTSSVNEVNRERCLYLGASDFLDKDFTDGKLAQQLEKYLQEKEE